MSDLGIPSCQGYIWRSFQFRAPHQTSGLAQCSREGRRERKGARPLTSSSSSPRSERARFLFHLSPLLSLGILGSVTTRKRNGQETEEGRKADLIKPLRSASFGYQKVILRGGHPNLGFRLFLYEVTSEALSLLCPTKLL